MDERLLVPAYYFENVVALKYSSSGRISLLVNGSNVLDPFPSNSACG